VGAECHVDTQEMGMRDQDKTREQLIAELAKARQRAAELEMLETEYKQAEEEAKRRAENLRSVSELAIELATAPPDVDLSEIVAEKLKSITGALATGIAVYDVHTRELAVEYVAGSNQILSKLNDLLGRDIIGMRVPVSADLLERMLTRVVTTLEDLWEVALDAIPKSVAAVIQKTFDIGHFAGLSLQYSDELIGAAVIVMSKGQPALSTDLMRVFAHVAAASLQRKQVERESQESEKKYRDLVESINDAIYVADANGVITYISPAIESISGYRSSEIVGRSFAEFIYPQDLPRVREQLEKFLSGHVEPTEYRVVIKSGDTRWIRSSSRPIFEGDRVIGLRGVITGIDERKRAEEALQRLVAELQNLQRITEALLSQEKLHRVMNAVADGIVTQLGYDMVLVTRYVEEESVFTGLALYPLPMAARFDQFLKLIGRTDLVDEPTRFQVPYRRGENPLVDRVIEGEMVIGDSLGDFFCPWIPRPAAAAAQKLLGLKTFVDLPMQVQGKTIGTIVASVREPLITDAQQQALVRVAGQAAVAVEKARLYQEVQRELAQRKRAEHEIEERRRYLEGILAAVPDAIVTLNAEHQVVEWNPGAEKLFRYSAQETVGRDLDDLITNPETREEASGFTQMALARKLVGPVETMRYRKDGSPVNVILAGAPIVIGDELIGLVAVYTDITERKRAEEALKEYSERLEEMVKERTSELVAQYARLDAILRSTADGIVVTDGEGNIIQTNPVAQRWLTQTLSPQKADRLRETVRDVATQIEGRPVELLELAGLDLELSVGVISAPEPAPMIDQPLQQGQGDPKVVVVLHDVSHFKVLDRMKTRFINNISHELKTPITTIKLYAYLMQQQPGKYQQYVEPLIHEADHQAKLLEDILEISSIDAGRVEIKAHPTLLNELTRDIVASHQALAHKQGVTLEHHPTELAPVALIDSQRTVQALNNLVRNAIRFTPEGGKVMVSVQVQEMQGRTWAAVAVSDTGMGIPEDEALYIFDRFFRGEKPRTIQLTGTGLGLSITKEIVELQGGRVTVESEEGVGATFTVWLPLAD
jgi:PAS domain S-box-containing protein